MEWNNKIPEWKNTGTEPSDDRKQKGFESGYKPPAGIFNWFWSLVSKAITELQTIVSDLVAHAANKDNPHGVTTKQLGLDKVDNTPDSEKSVNFATEAGFGNKVKSKLTVRFKDGSTEGTDLWTYDGSTAKSINITPKKIGASNASEHNIETYTSLEQMGLSDSTMSATDFATNIDKILSQLDDRPSEISLIIQDGINNNLHASLVAKLNQETDITFNTATHAGWLTIHFCGEAYRPTVIETNLETANHYGNVWACMYNKGADGNVITAFNTVQEANGFAPKSHNQGANTITAGTFAGQVVAKSDAQTHNASLLRNSKLVSSATNPTVNGEIFWTYE